MRAFDERPLLRIAIIDEVLLFVVVKTTKPSDVSNFISSFDHKVHAY